TAHLIIEKAGSFSNIFDWSIEELCSIKGINHSAASLVKFITYLSDKYADFPSQTVLFESFKDIGDYFLDFFVSYNSDTCLIINITQNLELLNTICFSINEIHSKISKEIAAEILKRNPSNIVIGIYYPLPFAMPTQKDYYLCKKLSDILKSLEIPFYDMIICSKTRTFSMRQKGTFSF
ncbi:MAG: hypothetical protein K2I80_00765, partial [Ruminococcus sp.]|nr:hypothetical protein [Ruminococcus sp.]